MNPCCVQGAYNGEQVEPLAEIKAVHQRIQDEIMATPATATSAASSHDRAGRARRPQRWNASGA
jgi:hypothetical protein